MDNSNNKKRWHAVLISAGIYLLIGVITSLVTNPLSNQSVQAVLRLLAFALSVVVYIRHIRFDIKHFFSTAAKTALNISYAVALGTLAIAILANINALINNTSGTMLLLALFIWPAVTGFLSFIVSFIITFVITRTRK
jgi:hypothetical protein